MIAIRGATTIECDNPQQIRERIKELLDALSLKNGLNDKNITCIIFSSTADITSLYPAKAAREAGYLVPLFSAAEPQIKGSLPLCIRVMILAEIPSPANPVYLHGAAALRKDLTAKINIAIDGPAGSGKSTIAKILGKKLGILCLDTGATYRACALKCINEGVDLSNETAVERALSDVKIDIEQENGAQKTILDGVDVSLEIRKPEISMAASKVSAYGFVREKLVALQRKFAAENSCVLDGRDIGTNVLPNAEFKFYLTASPEVRAERRFKENEEKGFKVPLKQIYDEIVLRDEQDKTRKIAPLKQAKDAIFVDTSKMTIEEVVAYIENKIQEKI